MRITFSGCGLQAVPNPTDFKFKKGQRVHLLFGEMYSSVFRGPEVPTTKGPGLRIKDCRIYQGEPQYKVECFTGWWPERNLVAVQN